ncbi:hypothetical protein [Frigoriglobus tundricola]|uniref:Carboxypeptidase regulatory-like domain-containing protein n=1 Tax=Frigoriglobus tundricola TaxID=2774151 RepID=A0A6M5YS46_9BACT|nr:hypothetical protein [Frigoriglobus tundricola]QJW96260.1 hypothetical protein FTUN_3817 [Frigoriglobus tundricola]
MKPLSRVLAFGILTACLASGCSKGGVNKLTVPGTVTYKGERLRSGILRVVGSNGSFATAPIRADGTFTLTDVMPGEVQVGITEEPRSSSASDGKGGKGGPAPKAVALPAQYQNPEKSGLKYTINEDTRSLDIELK